MPSDIVNKYRYVMKDTYRKVTYVIYSPKPLTKKEKIRHIHCWLHKKDYELPEEEARINIICGEE